METVHTGRVWKFGDRISTDFMMPGHRGLANPDLTGEEAGQLALDGPSREPCSGRLDRPQGLLRGLEPLGSVHCMDLQPKDCPHRLHLSVDDDFVPDTSEEERAEEGRGDRGGGGHVPLNAGLAVLGPSTLLRTSLILNSFSPDSPPASVSGFAHPIQALHRLQFSCEDQVHEVRRSMKGVR